MTTEQQTATYLGDGAYADLQPGAIRVYADREFITHEVYLEQDHLQNLINFAVEQGYSLRLPLVKVPDDVSILTEGMRKYYGDMIRQRDETAAKCAPVFAMLSEGLKKRASITGDFLDLDHLTREEVSEAMHLLSAGKWKREPSSIDGHIDYSATINGVNVRLYAAAPPNSCRMIEVEEIIPAQPEQIVKRRKLVCGGSTEQSEA